MIYGVLMTLTLGGFVAIMATALVLYRERNYWKDAADAYERKYLEWRREHSHMEQAHNAVASQLQNERRRLLRMSNVLDCVESEIATFRNNPTLEEGGF